MNTNICLLLALAAGMALPIQVGINSLAARHLQQPFHASALSFIVGAIALGIYSVLFTPFTVARISSLPLVLWGGGLLGVFYVMVTVVAGPKLGAALIFSCLIAGQLVISLLLDHYGLVGFPTQPISFGRILGVVLVAVGVLIVKRY